MFTDRYIKVPIKSVTKNNVTGVETTCDNYMKVNPFNIIYYKPGFDPSHPDEDCITICLPNGERPFVYLSIKAFEILLDKYYGAPAK